MVSGIAGALHSIGQTHRDSTGSGQEGDDGQISAYNTIGPGSQCNRMSQSLSLPLATNDDPFAQRLAEDGQVLARARLTTLQLNLGKMCNLACNHCHVESGPHRTEIMTWSVMQRILEWIDRYREELDIVVGDLTGGAPEMNPSFSRLIESLVERGIHVLDRCNLTILLEPGYEGLITFLAQHGVEIVASLPCYLEQNVDKQRGNGVFHGSIIALQKLNAVGYGQPHSDLRLDLVFNPVDYGLPPNQVELEKAYKDELSDHYGIVFNKLWTITNMPIKRFEHTLRRDGQFDVYMKNLNEGHNPDNVLSVMCRDLISIGWEGSVYDCDFNQMLQMPLEGPAFGDEHAVERQSKKLWAFTPDELVGRRISTGGHCFGCTAGSGSSCTGALR